MSGSLSSREKTLSILVGAIAFILVTFFTADYFFKHKARLNADLALKQRVLKRVQGLSAEKALYEQRDAWLREKQPKLVNEERTRADFLEQIKELAKKHAVLIDSSEYRATVRKPELPYVAIGIRIKTKSPWNALIAFLGELQTPEQFIAFDKAVLKVEDTDQTQMRGEFDIARWYAPK